LLALLDEQAVRSSILKFNERVCLAGPVANREIAAEVAEDGILPGLAVRVGQRFVVVPDQRTQLRSRLKKGVESSLADVSRDVEQGFEFLHLRTAFTQLQDV